VLVQELRKIQEHFGYLPERELRGLSERLDVPLHRINEVVSFFPHYRRNAPPDVEVHVCRDQACHLRGGRECLRRLREVAQGIVGDRRVKVEGVSCLGRCDGAPAVLIELHKAGHPDQARVLQCTVVRDYAERLRTIVAAHLEGRDVPGDLVDRSPRPWRIDPYYSLRTGAAGPKPAAAGQTQGVASSDPGPPAGSQFYEAARLFANQLKKVGSSDARQSAGDNLIVEALKTAELRGMGGAGVLAAIKWGDVRRARGEEKFIVCNADESEPATFKDREILLRTPELVIEGMVLAALLVRAQKGYIYVRHEYHDQIRVLNEAIGGARALGVVGRDVIGTGWPFELEVFESPGGYVCGEQGALIEALEERRAEPRNRPPQLETNGLFDKPTLLSNVETFAWVPAIVIHRGEWYAAQGRQGGPWYARKGKTGAKGLRFFSICGDLNRPGVYEVEIGSTLGELIDAAGGVRDGLALKAVALSGPSGGFVPASLTRHDILPAFQRNFPADRETIDVRELPLDLDELRTLGLMLGAGITVYAETAGVNMFDQALTATRFFRNESCGKCVPCRVGSQKLVQIGERVVQPGVGADVLAKDKALVDELLATLELTSICGLGMSAAKPLASAFQSFWNDLGLRKPID
jgi:NADH:ubiquinone oxidoreductase subunit F (NADH-binding)/NADH:ubiquinone oxidoreductase subunit E